MTALPDGLPELLSTRVPFAENGPSVARRAFDAVAGRFGGDADDARLLLSELVTNAVRHGRELADVAGGIAVRVLAAGSGVRVEVEGGSGEQPPRPLAGDLSHMPSGRGLRMVDQLAARWGLSWDGRLTEVWFELGTAPGAPPAPAAVLAAVHRAVGGAGSFADAVVGGLAALAGLSASDRAEYWSADGAAPHREAAVEAHATAFGLAAAGADVEAAVTAALDGGGPVRQGLLAAMPVRGSGRPIGVVALRTQRDDIDVVREILRPVAAQLGRLGAGDQRAHSQAVLAELAFLAEASHALASSLNYDETLQHVADLIVPARADWCTINVASREGGIRRAAVAHANPSVLGRLEEMLDSYPHDPDADTGVPLVIRTGEPLLFEEVPDSLLEETANDPEYLMLTRELRISSCVIVPLEARGRVLGTLSLVSTDHRRLRFGESDLAVALDLGRRAGMAIDNARLYTDRAYLAAALQRLLLPESLPDVPGLELAARYVPAADTTDVGGDFYDVVGGPAGEWYFLVGDVQGKGPDAATLIGLARHTVRTAAMKGDSPGEALQTLNRALLAAPTRRTCTAVCVRLVDGPDGRVATVARAGHPPPLLVRGQGCVPFEPAGMLLGIRPVDLAEDTRRLAAGDAVVLYSDGAYGRDQIDDDVLADRVARAAGDGADGIAAALLAAAGEEGPRHDDVTALVLRVI